MSTFRYTLDSSEKFTCPDCNHDNKFVRYRDVVSGDWVGEEYGKCDRENNCGYWKKIERNELIRDKSLIKYDLQRERSVFSELWLTDNYYNHHRENRFKCDRDVYLRSDIPHMFRYPGTDEVKYENIFLRGLVKKFGVEATKKVYDEFRLGTFYDGGVIFPYYDFNDKLITGKIMFYDDNLKRIKEGYQSYPMWLHNYKYQPVGHKYEIICDLPGEYKPDLTFFNYSYAKIKDINNIGIIESEKSAIILSILVPEIHWMATGGLNNLQKYKFWRLNSHSILMFPDLGYLPDKKMTVKKYWEYKIESEIRPEIHKSLIDFPNYIPPGMNTAERMEWNNDGSDVVDFIFNCNPKWLEGTGFNTYIEWFRNEIFNNSIL